MKAMRRIPNKKPQTLWSEYQAYDEEPKSSKPYELSPEMEDELLEYGPFLKQRVWRNMRKIERYKSKQAKRQQVAKKGYKINHLQNQRLAHL